MIGCLRPFAPEFAGFLSNWASFSQNFDSVSHYARVRGITGASQVNLYGPNIEVGRLRRSSPAPTTHTRACRVYGDGKPQFLESCGYTPDALDPAADPEDHRVNK